MDFIQFTYGYTKFKCEQSAPDLGGGVFNRTRGCDVLDYATGFISFIRQDFPLNAKGFSSFGYQMFRDTPFIFNACSRDMKNYKGLRGGEDYMAHVCMGEALTSKGYAIQYYNSKKEDMVVSTINDEAQPEFYRQLSNEEVENSMGEDLTTDRVSVFQKEHLSDLADLLSAIIATLETDKKIFIMASSKGLERDKDILAKWMAAALMLLPPAIANRVSFNTFLPEPADVRNSFTVCGVVDGVSKDTGSLAGLGSVFEAGERLVAKSEVPKNGFAEFLKNCNASKFEQWRAFSKNEYASKEITLVDLDYLMGAFKLNRDNAWPINEKLDFITNNIKHRYNKNDNLENALFQLIEDKYVNASPSENRLFVQAMASMVGSADSSSANVDRALTLIGLILFNAKNSREVLAQFVDEKANALTAPFTGGIWLKTKSFLTDSQFVDDKGNTRLQEICDAIENHIFDDSGKAIDKKVTGFLFRLYAELAIQRDNTVAMRIITRCARDFAVYGNAPKDLFGLAFQNKEIEPKKELRFFADLRTQDDDGSFCIEQEPYREELADALQRNQKSDVALEFFCNQTETEKNQKMVALLLSMDWRDSNKCLKRIFDILTERKKFESFEEAFDKRFFSILSESLESALIQEKESIARMDKAALENEIELTKNAIADFERIRQRLESGPMDIETEPNKKLLSDCITKLTAFRSEVLTQHDYYQTGQDMRQKRIEHVARALRLLPNRAIDSLLKRHGIPVNLPPKSSDQKRLKACEQKRIFVESATEALKKFLQDDSPEAFEKKTKVCDDIDETVKKHGAAYARGKKFLINVSNMLGSLIFAVLCALLTGIVSIVLYKTVGQGYFQIFYWVFPIVAFFVAATVYWASSNISRGLIRWLITVGETLSIIALFMLVCFVGLDVLNRVGH